MDFRFLRGFLDFQLDSADSVRNFLRVGPLGSSLYERTGETVYSAFFNESFRTFTSYRAVSLTAPVGGEEIRSMGGETSPAVR